jgi:hypothetical protein
MIYFLQAYKNSLRKTEKATPQGLKGKIVSIITIFRINNENMIDRDLTLP